MNWFRRRITIKLVHRGKETGQWIKCTKGDDTYNKLVLAYGSPLPKQIEVNPLNGR